MVQDDWNQGFVTGFVSGLSTSGPRGGAPTERFKFDLTRVSTTTMAFPLLDITYVELFNWPLVRV